MSGPAIGRIIHQYIGGFMMFIEKGMTILRRAQYDFTNIRHY